MLRYFTTNKNLEVIKTTLDLVCVFLHTRAFVCVCERVMVMLRTACWGVRASVSILLKTRKKLQIF